MTSLLYPIFDALHLPGLKTYFWMVVAATLFWQALYSAVFRIYESTKPGFYQKLSFIKKLDWAMHRIFLILYIYSEMRTSHAFRRRFLCPRGSHFWSLAANGV